MWITGRGAITAAGRTPEASFEALLAGRSAIAEMAAARADRWPVSRAAEIADFDARAFVPDRKRHKLLRRGDFLGLHAAAAAVRESAVAAHRAALAGDEGALFDDRTAVFVGAPGGAFRNQYEFLGAIASAHGDAIAFARHALEDVTPMWLLQSLPNNVLCHVGIDNGFKGPNACFTTHTVSGAIAAGEALAALRAGDADRALVIAHDAPIEPETVGHLDRLGVLAHGEVRPFDAGRSGMLLGEGAGALLLETEASASARGAEPFGELLGVGTAGEDRGLLAIDDDGDGLRRAIRAALDDADLRPRDVGLVVAHGNALAGSDDSEAAALRAVFGDDAPPITAFKWALGHLMAGAFAEAVLALEAARRRRVPAIATLREPSAACAGLRLASRAERAASGVALVLARGFAGTNAAVVLRAPAPGDA